MLAKCLPLLCEVLFVLVVPCLCERLYSVERGVVYSRLLYCPKFSLEVSLCGKSCVNELVEIFLCKGGDVELGARTSKHILVFAFDPLSPTLFYIVPCIDSYCSFILICLVLFVCVPYLC